MLATSLETVSDYKNYCRELCYQVAGKVVEIDESRFGKRKSHKGYHIEGQWVFGGICCTDKCFFLQPVPSRDKETLVPLIKEHIAPGKQ